MTVALILVVLALLALLFLLRLAKGRGLAVADESTPSQIRPVDIEAFRNLIDPAEEEYLRVKLSAREFRRIQRQRLRAALEYISCAAQNAAVLIRMGEAARHSPDPSVVEAGEKLVDSAIRLRLYAFQAMARLYLGIILPSARISPVGLAENYERMTGLVLLLGRLQYSNRASAAL